MKRPGAYVGSRVKRLEDPRLVLGKGRYVADFALPAMAHMAVLRSPHAHARIRSIDVQEARRMEGVLLILTGADLHGTIPPFRVELDARIHPSFKPCDWHVLTWDKVRHVGDPVAMVVAESRYLAEDALEPIAVEYEPLEPVTEPERARTDASALVHDEWGSNVHSHTEYSTGDPDQAFAQAHLIVSERFRTNRQHALPLEPRGCMATFDQATGDLTLWTSSQMPHLVRTKLAEHLTCAESRIRVIAPDVGGGFGLKCHVFPEEVLTCLAAMRLGRPVRWLEDRRESFIGSFHAKDEIVDAEIALAENGRLVGARLRTTGDIGAYSAIPFPASFEPIHTALSFPGPYRLSAYAYSATAVATNKPTVSTYRGVGMPIGTFVMEGLLDRAARQLQIDPIEIRRRNLIRTGEFPYQSVTGAEYDVGGYHECLEKAVEILDYEKFRREQDTLRARGICRGIGFACFNEETGLGSVHFHHAGVPISAYEAANIKLDPSGHATVFCGTHSHGQAHETIYAQIAADELGLPLEKVTVHLGDTATTPYGWGTWGSRAAVSGGGAVLTTAQQLAAKIRRLAGHYLEVAADDIELVDGQARVKGAPSRMITITEVARRAIFTDASQLPPGDQPGLDMTQYYDTPNATYANGTHVATVEVDVETGNVKILRYIVVGDCGRMINPMIVDGQISGGVAQGLGGALLEHLVYDDDGQLLCTSFMDYLVPTAADVPSIEIGHVETPSPIVAGGFKGAGEGGAVAPFAVIANAIADALASFAPNITQLPLSPERVHRFTQQMTTAKAE